VTNPRGDIQRCADAHARLDALVIVVDDTMLAQPSLLPGWSVGHVLTHIARNADSHIRRAEASARGEVVEQYEGGAAGRAAEIAAGARRGDANAVIEDVAATSWRLEQIWNSVPEAAWDAVTRDLGGRERKLRELPALRWIEVEVHIVDLGIGRTFHDWPDDFVEDWLAQIRPSMVNRMPKGATKPSGLDSREELAWLLGRLARPDLPVLTALPRNPRPPQ
jgi:maleylpyruvate isomerase